ncbi:helix-turn-helix domain-containing protein [Pseudofrankia inefficax]|uniref:Regulatory protein MerR n=1 Tax=Pseudofrankia inefficax (strain DSM 45817 / CECT 9037 / DDB 130130 / EuI1c) TaxID=298654 RepID=E3J653_PSEI1|nr:helix-turn-helix domain-containing protein [Pseudofrankia inefficax]ADP78344.1 regulatory protein MerR [Pseudofrankia inefficax]
MTATRGVNVARLLGPLGFDAAESEHRVARYEWALEAIGRRLGPTMRPEALAALERHLRRLPGRGVVLLVEEAAVADLAALCALRELLGQEPPAGWAPAALLLEALIRRAEALARGVFVPAAVAGDVGRLLRVGLDVAARRDGGDPTASSALVALLTDLAAAAREPLPCTDIGTGHQRAEHRGLSVAEAAARMGCTPSYVRRLARRGAIPARRSGGVWIVTETPGDDDEHGGDAAS